MTGGPLFLVAQLRSVRLVCGSRASFGEKPAGRAVKATPIASVLEPRVPLEFPFASHLLHPRPVVRESRRKQGPGQGGGCWRPRCRRPAWVWRAWRRAGVWRAWRPTAIWKAWLQLDGQQQPVGWPPDRQRPRWRGTVRQAGEAGALVGWEDGNHLSFSDRSGQGHCSTSKGWGRATLWSHTRLQVAAMPVLLPSSSLIFRFSDNLILISQILVTCEE